MSLRQISTVQNMPILDLETGSVLGRVVSWVIKAKEQRVAAFLLNKAGPFKESLIIVPADVIEYGPDMIVARDKDSIISPQEIVGLPKLIAQKYTLIGFRAETESGTKLGKVEDFVFDTINSEIKTYYITADGIIGIIGDGRVIPSEQVLQIQPGKVIFTNGTIKLKAKPTKKQIASHRA